MQKIYSADNLIQVHHIKNILESHQIECIIKNQNLTSIAGEVPSVECWPQVWLINPEQADLANQLIEQQKSGVIDTTLWECHSCREKIDANFEICWQCGTLKP
ncbi:DUF2007 domain-containing protein [Thalassotalea aquiviva]|uniref:putative signal transducing protein n=1 Tax=Thalassotalea aquiviva TaxID=3242415 RepID=UPI00352BA1D0